MMAVLQGCYVGIIDVIELVESKDMTFVPSKMESYQGLRTLLRKGWTDARAQTW
jgi:hypothetical protein